MLSKNNAQEVIRRQSRTVPHYGLRKLSIGVASVLLSTTLYAGVSAQADTLNQPTDVTTAAVTQASSSSASGNSSTDAPVSAQAQPSANLQSNAVNQPAASTATPVLSSSASSNLSTDAPVSAKAQPSANLQSNAVNQPSASTVTPVLSSAPSSENTPTVSATQPQASVDKQVNPVNSSTGNPAVPSSQNQMGRVINLVGKQLNLATVPTINAVSVTNNENVLNDHIAESWVDITPKGDKHYTDIQYHKDKFEDQKYKVLASWVDSRHLALKFEGIDGFVNDINGSFSFNFTISNDKNLTKDKNGAISLNNPGSVTEEYSLSFYDKLNGMPNTTTNKTSDLIQGKPIVISFPENDFVGSAWMELWSQAGNSPFNQLDDLWDASDLNGLLSKRPDTEQDFGAGNISSRMNIVNDDLKDFGVDFYLPHTVQSVDATQLQDPRITIHHGTLGNPEGWINVDGNSKWEKANDGSNRWVYSVRHLNFGQHGEHINGIDFTQLFETKNFVPVNVTDGSTSYGYTGTFSLGIGKNSPEIEEINSGKMTTTQVATVKYVDDEGSGAQVGTTQTLKGTTGSKVATNIKAPTNYVLSGTYPAEYTFTDVANQQLVVHLKHAKQNVNDQKQVTRTVNYTDPTTKQTKTVTTQTVTLQRTGMKDLVTNETKWNDWNTGQWTKVDAPKVTGYRVTNPDAAATMTVTSGTSNTTVTFAYVSDHQDSSIVYVDDDKGGAQVKTVPLSGNTGDTVKTNIVAPSGYVLNGTYSSEYTFKQSGNTAITVHLKHDKQSVNDQKQVVRTVNYTDPNTKQTKLVERQTATLHRTGTKDLVTNNINWNAWSADQFKAVSAPSVAGYQVTNGNAAGAMTVNDQSKDSTVTFTYTANAQTTHVKYVDKDNPSNVIHTTNVSGKTDQTVSVPSEVPVGWQLVSGQNVPKNVTFTATGYPDTIVKIEHKHVTVTPDHPKTTNDKLPDNPTKNYPVGVDQNDLNKTVTRTIQVVDPDTKKTTSTTQTAHLTRTADIDEVSGMVTYGKWTTGQWVAFVPPVVTGYTPNVKEVPAMTVADTTKDQTVTITYAPSQQSMRIIFVDHNHPDNVIKTQTITGKTNQMVPVPNGTPAGWVLTPGQKVPEHISFSPQGHDDVVVEIQHGHVTVTPDAPKTTADKLPDNPTKSYPVGVAKDDLNKTLTRTINVTDPHTKKVATTTQKVHLSRTATVDEVDGTVTYGKWTTGEWSAFDTPIVAGYTPSQANVEKVTVNDATKDQTVNITYTANDHSALINYVDPTGKVVHSTKVNGKTDQTVKVPSEVPAGWKLVNGQTVPGELAFGPDGHANVTVKIEHQHLIINPENPVDNPAGVTKNDLNKTIARTINVRPPHGDVKTIKQTVHLTRTADVDVVTKQVVYSKWTTGTWESYTAPQEAGYTPTLSKVNAVTVTDQTKPATVDISYVANPQKTQVNYVDDDNQQKLVTTVALAGKTDQTVPTNIVAPANYVLVGNYPVNYTFKTGENVAIVVHLAHQHKATDDSTVVVRVINYVDPADDQTKPLTIQKVTLKRTGDQDLITKQIKWQKWSEGEFTAYDAPEIIGYTATPVKADQATVEQGDKTVTVHYQPNAQATHIKYATTEGQIIYTSTINGHTKETIKVPNDMPKGWKLVSGSNIPDTITFEPTGHADVTVLIEHRHTTVDLDHLSHGLTADDLQKVMTRTIVVTDPAGSAKTTKQTAQLTRTADVDEVTGKVEYSSWQPGTWDEYVVPTIAGYTPTQEKVERQVLTAPGDDVQVNVAYQADAQETQVIIVDPRGNVVKTTPLTGVTDETVPVKVELPAGWELANPDEVPATITFGPDGHEPVKVPAKHQTLTVGADHAYSDGEPLPGNPAITAHGISKDDLRKVITRTIKINKPDGTVDEVVQRATLDRQATVDLVTGAVVYEPWSTAEWPEFNAPTIDGYTPDQGKIMAQTVRVTTPNQIEVINYRANAKPAQLSSSVETPAKATANPVTTTKSTTQGDAQLPQTGNSDNDLATIGLLAAGSLGLIAVKKKRETE